MAHDKLVIDERHGQFRIAWFLEDEQDIGLYVGEDIGDTDAESEDGKECKLVEEIAKGSKGVESDGFGLYWESASGAKAALGQMNAALKVFRSSYKCPWPDWAIKAQAAGWKPPKGWHP